MMKRQVTKKGRGYVAMSGGVDSSVAAALLKKQGYDVIGVFMRPWSPGLITSDVTVNNRHRKSVIHRSDIQCQWQRDREDAMRVAARIGIPLLTWDFSKKYKKEVADYMIREYKVGRTPNPDVMCNKHIKFGLFLEKALKEGADYVATGHYIKIKNVKIKMENNNLKSKIVYKLLKAKDKNKDQSYFLWTLTQKQLKHCLFPIGDYIKPEVRKIAKEFGLPTADKKDSQGVCFIGPLDMKEFLKKYIKPKRGEICLSKSDIKGVSRSDLENRSVIGYHDGVFYYTIGQRHGLNINNGRGPYFVIKKDINKNIIYVGTEDGLKESAAKVVNVNWISTYDGHHQCIEIDVKIRYRSKPVKAVLFKNGDLRFKKPIRAITPGQSAVFYKGQELIGGGIIA